MWLNYFVTHCPDYKIVIIDQKCLSQLSGNNTIIDSFNTVFHDKDTLDKQDKNNNRAMDNTIPYNKIYNKYSQNKENILIQKINLLDMYYIVQYLNLIKFSIYSTNLI